jgi:hypothetical protein
VLVLSFHHDEAGKLEVLDQTLGDDRRHELVGVVDALVVLRAGAKASAQSLERSSIRLVAN